MEIHEIISALPQGRTMFHYYEDRYAFLLLNILARRNLRIGDLKNSCFSPLLQKPAVKEKIAKYGSGRLEPYIEKWPLEHFVFLLTLGKWGPDHGDSHSWFQTSRKGNNLVLQLNFSNRHDGEYYRLIRPEGDHPFEWNCHPIHKKRRTLAWARLDIDLKNGEVLIEEIQSDWIRDAFRDGMLWMGLPAWEYADDYERKIIRRLRLYLKNVLEPYRKIWEEAMMAATVWFILHELGIHKMFYHTYESGNFLKGLDNFKCKPPVSLYTRLPRKFCFTKTNEIPSFMMNENSRKWKWGLKHKKVGFYKLEL